MCIHTAAITVRVNVGRQPTQVSICLNMHMWIYVHIGAYIQHIYNFKSHKKNEVGCKGYLPKSHGIRQLARITNLLLPLTLIRGFCSLSV